MVLAIAVDQKFICEDSCSHSGQVYFCSFQNEDTRSVLSSLCGPINTHAFFLPCLFTNNIYDTILMPREKKTSAKSLVHHLFRLHLHRELVYFLLYQNCNS